jgi:hypothetical protein
MRVADYVAHFDPPDYDPFEDTLRRRRKRRRMSIARAINQMKNSGVDLIVDGTKFTFKQSEPDSISEADAEQLWLDRIKKHAAH